MILLCHFIRTTLLFFVFTQSTWSQANDTVWIEKFNPSSITEYWQPNKNPRSTTYEILDENQGHFLRVTSHADDNFLLKEISTDLAEHPFLHWKWRAQELPQQGNEHHRKTADAAGAIYIVLRASKWRPQSIKMTWSTTLNENDQGKSPFAIWPARSDFIVAQAGDNKLGVWVEEKINVFDLYKNLYNDPDCTSKTIKVIALMTDSDNTKSRAVCDYDNIYFTKY